MMVFIHGGVFLSGSGSLFHGDQLALAGDVIVVTFNYRLGALGFLTTADDQAPGNMGLLDQVNTITTGYIPACDYRFETTQEITMHVVTKMNHFFKIFYQF